MNDRGLYSLWLSEPIFDAETKKELNSIKGNEKEIEDRFYKDLEFGTGGMRGVIGAGTNRMNRYTVRRATQGLANHIKSNKMDNKGVAIAFDPRYMSAEFAEEAALVLAGNGIRAFLFESLRPTPELSFAVRLLGCASGIVITASHNPKEYNGYKVYSNDGCQMPPEESDAVIQQVMAITDFGAIPIGTRQQALEDDLLAIIGPEVDDAYIAQLKKVLVNPSMVRKEGGAEKIIFTPIHGTGNLLIRRILKEIGIQQVVVVPEQELPDGSFPTVKSPNPEEKEAFTMAIALAKKEGANVIIGTDPDADRIGVVVRDSLGEFQVLTGNQTGCLLLEYILSQKKSLDILPENAFVVKTVVTTELARKIASRYHVELMEVLTGFKFIGEKIREYDDTGLKKYQFGFEESYGYLAGTHARDKDAVVAAMLIAEMVLYYRTQNKSLYDALQDIYTEYGYVKETIDSFTLKGIDGVETIDKTMNALRNNALESFGNIKISVCRDYEKQWLVSYRMNKKEKLLLPVSNVLYYETESGDWFCIRPSGTEPKIKIYYGASADSESHVMSVLENLQKNVLTVVKPLLGL